MDLGCYHIPLLTAVLAIALLTVFVYQMYYYARYMAGVNRYYRRKRKTPASDAASKTKDYPPASVIICARNEGENLEKFLPKVLEQTYGTYEVIVVNDASEDNTQDVLERFQLQYPHLRTTFIPHDARVRSRKKLALTLAVKSAKYEYLVLTDADCCPATENWLSGIMSGFHNEETEIVLGYGAYYEHPALLNRLIAYDTLFNGLQYLGMAYARHPYMGVGRNLAYRKSTFVRNHGFEGLQNERAGDDDLFVNKVANRCNTTIAVMPESLTWSVPKSTFGEWIQQKRRHLSVAPKYKFSTRLQLLLEPLTRGLFYALFIALTVAGDMWIRLFAGGLLLIRWIVRMLILRISARNLQVRKVGAEASLFDIFLPLNSLWLMFYNRLHKPQRW